MKRQVLWYWSFGKSLTNLTRTECPVNSDLLHHTLTQEPSLPTLIFSELGEHPALHQMFWGVLNCFEQMADAIILSGHEIPMKWQCTLINGGKSDPSIQCIIAMFRDVLSQWDYTENGRTMSWTVNIMKLVPVLFCVSVHIHIYIIFVRAGHASQAAEPFKNNNK